MHAAAHDGPPGPYGHWLGNHFVPEPAPSRLERPTGWVRSRTWLALVLDPLARRGLARGDFVRQAGHRRSYELGAPKYFPAHRLGHGRVDPLEGYAPTLMAVGTDGEQPVAVAPFVATPWPSGSRCCHAAWDFRSSTLAAETTGPLWG